MKGAFPRRGRQSIGINFSLITSSCCPFLAEALTAGTAAFAAQQTPLRQTKPPQVLHTKAPPQKRVTRPNLPQPVMLPVNPGPITPDEELPPAPFEFNPFTVPHPIPADLQMADIVQAPFTPCAVFYGIAKSTSAGGWQSDQTCGFFGFAQ